MSWCLKKKCAVGALCMFSYFSWVRVAGWPHVGKMAAHSACDMFRGVGAWLLVWFFPTSVFGVGIFF